MKKANNKNERTTLVLQKTGGWNKHQFLFCYSSLQFRHTEQNLAVKRSISN